MILTQFQEWFCIPMTIDKMKFLLKIIKKTKILCYLVKLDNTPRFSPKLIQFIAISSTKRYVG